MERIAKSWRAFFWPLFFWWESNFEHERVFEKSTPAARWTSLEGDQNGCRDTEQIVVELQGVIDSDLDENGGNGGEERSTLRSYF